MNPEVFIEVPKESRRFNNMLDKAKQVVGRVGLSASLMLGAGAAGGTALDVYESSDNVAEAAPNPSDPAGYPYPAGVTYRCGSDGATWCYQGRQKRNENYYSNCTDYVDWILENYMGVNLVGGNGANWVNAARSAGYRVDGTPEPGDIFSTRGTSSNPYGHVGMIESVNADGSVNTINYNGFTGTFFRSYNKRYAEYADINGTGKHLSFNGASDPEPEAPLTPKLVDGTETTGDFNGDGFDEVVAEYDYGGNRMRLWTFWGGAGGLNRDRNSHTGLITEWNPAQSEIVGVGDVNGDGFDDVVLEYLYSDNRMRLWTFLGSATGLSRENVVKTRIMSAWDANRSEAVGVGDVNGDGLDDAILEYNYGGDRMRIWTFLGATNGLSRDRFSYTALVTLWNAANSEAVGVGDVNGDGLDDAIFEYLYSGNRMRLFSFIGGSSGLSNDNVPNSGLIEEWDASRSESVGVGDTNGDRKDDIVLEYNYGGNRMRLWTFLGGSTGLNKHNKTHSGLVYEWDPNLSDASGVGDVNGDGLDDVVFEYSYTGNRMRLWTWKGTPSGLTNTSKTNTGIVYEWDASRSEL